MKNDWAILGLMVILVGCSPSIREGIYIGQRSSYIEIGPNHIFRAHDVLQSGNAIRPVAIEDTTYGNLLEGIYSHSADKLSIVLRTNDTLVARMDEHNIYFGGANPDQKWSRWYGGDKLYEYLGFRDQLLKFHRDIIIMQVYELANIAAAYKHISTIEGGGGGSYTGFEILNKAYSSFQYGDRSIHFTIVENTGSEIKFEGRSMIFKGAFVDITLDENGRITAGPNSTGF